MSQFSGRKELFVSGLNNAVGIESLILMCAFVTNLSCLSVSNCDNLSSDIYVHIMSEPHFRIPLTFSRAVDGESNFHSSLKSYLCLQLLSLGILLKTTTILALV